jgi:hypothetical protein
MPPQSDPASNDLVERLRNREGFVIEGPRRLMMACEEAAKTIETKDAEIASLQTELERERSGYQLEHEAADVSAPNLTLQWHKLVMKK